MHDIEIINNRVLYKGNKVQENLSSKILSGGEQYYNFLVNLMKNPSNYVVQHLFDFVDLFCRINDDGTFVAYKTVREDYTDIYSSTISNIPSSIVSMPRNEVDDNYHKECSCGLHAGAYWYAYGFAVENGRIIEVEVSPENVVSVCKNLGKIRVSQYKVISELINPDLLYDGYNQIIEQNGKTHISAGAISGGASLMATSDSQIVIPQRLTHMMLKFDDVEYVKTTYNKDGSILISRGEWFNYDVRLTVTDSLRIRIAHPVSSIYSAIIMKNPVRIVVAPIPQE